MRFTSVRGWQLAFCCIGVAAGWVPDIMYAPSGFWQLDWSRSSGGHPRITRLLSGSPAADAGLQVGDILQTADGVPLTADRLQEVVQGIQANRSVEFGVLRGDQQITIQAQGVAWRLVTLLADPWLLIAGLLAFVTGVLVYRTPPPRRGSLDRPILVALTGMALVFLYYPFELTLYQTRIWTNPSLAEMFATWPHWHFWQEWWGATAGVALVMLGAVELRSRLQPRREPVPTTGSVPREAAAEDGAPKSSARLWPAFFTGLLLGVNALALAILYADVSLRLTGRPSAEMVREAFIDIAALNVVLGALSLASMWLANRAEKSPEREVNP